MENKDPGYILLHRSIKQHWLWNNPNNLKRWLDIIISAAFADSEQYCQKTHQVITVRRGCLWTSVRSLADRWECSPGAVTRFLKLLEREKMITFQGTQGGTFVNVLNYGLYQDFRGVSRNSKRNAKRDADGTQTERRRVTSNTLNTLNTLKEDNICPPADGGEWQ